MACSYTATRAVLTACGATKSGLDEQKSWNINRSDATFGAISASTGISATATFGSALLPFAFDARGFSMTDTMSTDANTGAQTHKPVISGRLIGLNGVNRADSEKFKGVNIVNITLTKGNKFIVNGRTAGLTLDTQEIGSGSENLGHLLTLSTTEQSPESEPYFELLITDYATTLAALIDAETP